MARRPILHIAAVAVAGRDGLRAGVAGSPQSRFFNKRAFDAAHAFYERHGGITIVIARFMPFVRTFAPFVAGVAEMSRTRFTMFNVGGALLWVVSLTLAGYVFGNLEWVQQNLSKIIWAMVVVPGLLAIWGGWRARSQPA